jgi:hypothetical protein
MELFAYIKAVQGLSILSIRRVWRIHAQLGGLRRAQLVAVRSKVRLERVDGFAEHHPIWVRRRREPGSTVRGFGVKDYKPVEESSFPGSVWDQLRLSFDASQGTQYQCRCCSDKDIYGSPAQSQVHL